MLKVGGRQFDGWTDVSIDRPLDALCGAFTLGLTERWPGQPERWRIEAGDAAQLLIDDEPIIDGWIDQARYSLSPNRHAIQINGRDRTCDLVDCSALHTPGFWTNRTLLQIATELCAPFGITVTIEGDPGAPFARFALEPGETVLDAIVRMTALRGYLATTDKGGNLLLMRPTEQVAGFTLVEGETIEQIEFDNSVVGRFSEYRLLAHDTSDEAALSAAARPGGSATDPGVKRHRPLLILADEETTAAGLDASALWEASVRAGQAQMVRVLVSGWRAPDGAVWRPNRIVPVRAPTVGIHAELLVSAVKFRRGATEGSRCELSLVRPEAYSLKPVASPPGRRVSSPPPGDRS
jgi:prophage tail gpP-like protein